VFNLYIQTLRQHGQYNEFETKERIIPYTKFKLHYVVGNIENTHGINNFIWSKIWNTQDIETMQKMGSETRD